MMNTITEKLKLFFKQIVADSKNFYIKEQIREMIQNLDKIETEPVLYGSNKCYAKELILIQEAEILFSNHQENSELQKDLFELKQRMIALKFRLEKSNGGVDRKMNPTALLDKLINAASDWKRNQPIFLEEELTHNDKEELKNCSTYPEFAELLLKSREIQSALFNWIIRDQNECHAFIQFPSLVNKLMECNLTGRLSCLGKHLLKIAKKPNFSGVREKIVTLPFEGRDLNILDENKIITFRGNLSMTVKEIFEVFRQKELKAGNLEFMQEGIINWNIHHLGYFDTVKNDFVRIDLNQKEWWKQLPFFEVLSLKQAKARYGSYLDGTNWSAAAAASRGTPTLSYEKTHAFLEVAVPIGFRKYAVYDFGKLAYNYPGNFLELLDVFCKNVHATVAYPDDNVFFSHRQQALHPFAITEEQGMRLMQFIKNDILEARRYNFIYQIESENCAKWVNKKLEAILGPAEVPNLYRMQLLDTEPEGPVMSLFRLIKKLPKEWQVPVLSFLHLFLGAARETEVIENGQLVRKSLASHSFFKTGEVYLPAFMHNELLAGRLKRHANSRLISFAVGLVAEKHRWAKLLKTIVQKTISFGQGIKEILLDGKGIELFFFVKLLKTQHALALNKDLTKLE